MAYDGTHTKCRRHHTYSIQSVNIVHLSKRSNIEIGVKSKQYLSIPEKLYIMPCTRNQRDIIVKLISVRHNKTKQCI